MKRVSGQRFAHTFMASHGALGIATIEKAFAVGVLDLREVVVPDGIDILPDETGFRVRSHDVHGPLPDIGVKDCGDTFHDKERLSNEVCKLIAIVKLRDQLSRRLPGGKFLPPTVAGNQAIVGFRLGRRTWLAEGADFISAYHNLQERVGG